jgi:hypothetical protein
MHVLKLFILAIIIVLSFYFFNHFLDIPFEASTSWQYVSWGGVTVLFFILIFFFNDLKINISHKIQVFRARSILTNVFLLTEVLLKSIYMTFFVFVLSAYFTMYFAKVPFTENVTILRLKCDEHFKEKYAYLPAYTHVRFSDEITLEHYTLTFRDNICTAKPNIAYSLPGKKAILSGRKSFFGKFYENIRLI